ncbi:MAG TPA: DNA N-6-adenine-methyltransferase [Candidatus Sulfopaludibacter sp.]|nr:DNA N-6-adenine-methyltransferase [Candidatus Sulfopaludibacter sp.]
MDTSTLTKLSDEWRTPQWLFDELNKEFNFDIDLCATKENSKCKNYYTNIFAIVLFVSSIIC